MAVAYWTTIVSDIVLGTLYIFFSSTFKTHKVGTINPILQMKRVSEKLNDLHR